MGKQKIISVFSEARGKLKAIAASYLHNNEDEEDALQDAFCRLWNNIDIPENAEEGSAVVALKRICIDYLRKRKSHESLDSVVVSDYQDTSSSLWEKREIQEYYTSIVSGLPGLQRDVFELHSKGMGYDSIALELGITESAVRQNMCRARKHLRNEYEKFQNNRH